MAQLVALMSGVVLGGVVMVVGSNGCKTQIQQVEKVQRTEARWTCRRWRNTSSVGEMLDELQWPTLEARRDQSSLLFLPQDSLWDYVY